MTRLPGRAVPAVFFISCASWQRPLAWHARNAELELGGPRAFPVNFCVTWTAELGLGILDVFVGVESRPQRLTLKAELEALAAGARPAPHERNRGIGTPALGASDGLLADSHLPGELGLGKPCAVTDGAKQVTRHFGLPVRELAPAS